MTTTDFSSAPGSARSSAAPADARSPRARQLGDRVAADVGTLEAGTHSLLVGYLTWILGVFGAHRFYYGRPLTGTLWFFTGGLLLVGWIVDLFLIPNMQRTARRRYTPGAVDYNVAWVLLTFLGPLGVHRLYMGKWVSGVALLLIGTGTLAFPPLGLIALAVYLYDFLTLNEQISRQNAAF